MHALTLNNINLRPGDAAIHSENIRSFLNMAELLTSIGCAVEELEPVVERTHGWTVPLSQYNVRFPEGATHLKRPKEASSIYTASGHKKKGAKAETPTMSMDQRKGQVLVRGDGECDYVVTYYKQQGLSPRYISSQVHAVEKEE